MHVYVAEARFELKKPPQSVDLARYVKLTFIERIDTVDQAPPDRPDEVIPFKNAQFANNLNPDRRWCDAGGTAICIQSYYKLEGKLPVGVALVNKLKEGGRKIADFIDFQSELRAVPAEGHRPGRTGQADRHRRRRSPASLEQNIFYVNQVMQFGKFLAVFQQHPNDAGKTVVSAFMALGVDSELLEKKKEYGKMPVLRNLIPAQVISGNSSFNTGTSISAGLPKYARNQIRAVAGAVRARVRRESPIHRELFDASLGGEACCRTFAGYDAPNIATSRH